MKFQIGDILLGCNFTFDLEYNDLECEVISGMCYRKSRHEVLNKSYDGLMYVVVWSNGTTTCQPEYNLKKLPPKDAKTEWEDVDVWRPEEELVHR